MEGTCWRERVQTLTGHAKMKKFKIKRIELEVKQKQWILYVFLI